MNPQFLHIRATLKDACEIIERDTGKEKLPFVIRTLAHSAGSVSITRAMMDDCQEEATQTWEFLVEAEGCSGREAGHRGGVAYLSLIKER